MPLLDRLGKTEQWWADRPAKLKRRAESTRQEWFHHLGKMYSNRFDKRGHSIPLKLGYLKARNAKGERMIGCVPESPSIESKAIGALWNPEMVGLVFIDLNREHMFIDLS